MFFKPFGRRDRHRRRHSPVRRECVCRCAEQLENRLLLTALPNGDVLRTYRLAVSATAEYTAFFGDDRIAAQQEIAIAVDSINEILNRELNVHLDLIENLDIIFGGDHPENDPFGSSLSNALDQNQTLLDSEVGAAGYDIGHVFGTFSGGLATVGSVGMDGIKAQGASGTSSPEGTDFELLAVHEMAHQFGATHTFNGLDEDGTEHPAWNQATAWAPGSGSTIMSFAGILPPVFEEPPAGENLQNQPDDYLHSGNIDQIVSHLEILDDAGVGTMTTGVNQIPTVDAGADFTIPAATPFALTASGSDGDGDELLYTFEQMDTGPAQTVDPTADPSLRADNGESPLFRSFEPAPADESTSFTRLFPQRSDILTGTQSKGEQLPTTNRSLNFRATVRDQQGGTNGDDVQLSVVDTGSPFEITTLNSNTTLTGGASQDITWNVAGTTANGIDVSQVEILFSTDGGQSFEHLLDTTANDGSHTVSLPNIDTPSARFLVRAVDNIFFDITDADVALQVDTSVAGATITESDGDTSVGEVSAIGAATDSYTIALNTEPAGTVDVTVSGDGDVLVSPDGSAFSPSISLSIVDTTPRTIYLRAFNDADVEGLHTGTITQTVSASSDPDYPVGLLMNSVDVTVIDDERTPLIGVDLQSDGQTVPANWTEINENDDVFQATTFADLIREDGSSTVVDLTVGPPESQGISHGPSDPDDATVPIHTPSLADAGSVLGWASLEANLVNAVWSDLIPGATYNVYVMTLEKFSSDINQTVTITGDGSDDPAPFTQTTSGFAGELQINNQQGSDSQPLEDFALTVTADSLGEINIELTRDDGLDSNLIYLGALALQRALVATSEADLPEIGFDTETGAFSVSVFSDEDVRVTSRDGSTGSVVVSVNGLENMSFDPVMPGEVQSLIITGGPGSNLLDLSAVDATDFNNSAGVSITVSGGIGNDTIAGSAFGDMLSGEAGNDFLLGGLGADTLSAGDGDDLAFGSIGNDSIDGGAGRDTVLGALGADTLSGGDGDDSLFGGLRADSIRGGAGNDLILGLAGRDTLIGESGNDTIQGGAGQDSIAGSAGADSLSGQLGADGINAGLDADTVSGDTGEDTLLGLGGIDILHGGLQDDILIGGDDDDDLTGAGGTDTLAGGNGNDVFDDPNEVDESFTEDMFAELLALG